MGKVGILLFSSKVTLVNFGVVDLIDISISPYWKRFIVFKEYSPVIVFSVLSTVEYSFPGLISLISSDSVFGPVIFNCLFIDSWVSDKDNFPDNLLVS